MSSVLKAMEKSGPCLPSSLQEKCKSSCKCESKSKTSVPLKIMQNSWFCDKKKNPFKISANINRDQEMWGERRGEGLYSQEIVCLNTDD